MEALILVGGLGTRLRDVVRDCPKPMAVVAGRPFVEYLLLQLRKSGFRDVVLCVGCKASYIEDYFGCGERLELRLRYSREDKPLGTAGAIKQALPLILGESFLVLNGDSFFDVDLEALTRYHRDKNAVATIALASVEDRGRYGAVEIGGIGEILSFSEKAAKEGGLINGGVYVLDKTVVETVPIGESVSLEMEVFPSLEGNGIFGFPSQGYIVDIGTPKSYLDLCQQPDCLVAAVLGRDAWLQREKN